MKDIVTESLSKDEGDSQIYELGYHLLPTVPEEEVSREMSKIHSLLGEYGGSVIAEGAPIMRPLAYDITKKIETKSLKFNKAYFGWVKFEMERSQIGILNKKVEALSNVLRSIIIKTVKENTMHTPKIPMFKKESVRESVPQETADKLPVSEAEIDKSIDKLLVNEN